MRETMLIFVLALALPCSTRGAVALVQQGTPAREPSPKEGQQPVAQGGYAVKVNVDSVFLNVSVRERTTNRSIAGLPAYVEHIDPKVVLIDGRRLAELMIDFDVGVSLARTYHIKRLDSDYFEEG